MVYLIHFEEKLHHAQHYLGFTEFEDPNERLERHKAGDGAKILRALNEKGISYSIVRTWNGDRKLERKLKNWKKSKQLCPICNPKIKL